MYNFRRNIGTDTNQKIFQYVPCGFYFAWFFFLFNFLVYF